MSPPRADLVFVAMFFVGLIQFGAAICRLGFLINFLGHPVISGFTSGAAITIGLSQFKFWLGISIPKSQYCHETIKAICTKVLRGKAHWMPFLLGVITYYMLKGVKELATKKPKTFGWMKPLGPLIICTLSLVMMIIPGLGDTLRDDYGVQTIGLVPSGLPPFTLPRVLRDVPSKASTVLPTAISAALIGFMESIAIGKSIAAKHGEELSAGKELGAIGLANLIGSFAAGYPVAGSFSRSAVANSTGAKTPLAGLVTGLFVMLALVILPSFIRKLPKFVLATIVISSVVNLVAIGEAKHLWKVRKLDFMLWVIAFLGTLFAGVLYGLIIAVGMSLIVVLYESVRPQISVLWKLPGTAIYRNVKQGESPGQFVKGVLVVRVGASMYFANVAYIKDTIIELCRQVEDTKYVVVEMTPVTSVDSTALHMLEDLFADMRRKGVEVCLASIGSRVEETLRLAGVQRKCGYEWFHDNVAHAVEFCIRHAAAHKAVVGRLEDIDSLDMTEPSQGTLRMRRASNASSDNLEKEDKKSVLVMAAKHQSRGTGQEAPRLDGGGGQGPGRAGRRRRGGVEERSLRRQAAASALAARDAGAQARHGARAAVDNTTERRRVVRREPRRRRARGAGAADHRLRRRRRRARPDPPRGLRRRRPAGRAPRHLGRARLAALAATAVQRGGRRRPALDLVLEVRGARARRGGGRRRGGQGREAHPGRALGAVYPLPLDPRPPRRV